MSYQNLIKYKFTSLTVLLLMLVTALNGQTISKKRKDLESKRKELQQQIQLTKKELQQVKTQESNSIKQLEVIGKQINTREKMIEHISQETFEISIEIANQKQVIEGFKTDLLKLKADYANYLISAYKKRDANESLFILFDSKGLNQAFRRIKYLNNYGEYRQKQAHLILNTQKEMILALETIIQIKQEKMGLIHLTESEKKELIQDKNEKNILLNQVQKKVKNLKQIIAEKEKAAKNLNHAIDNLIALEIETARKAEEKKRKAEAKKLNSLNKPKTANSYLSSEDLKLSGDFAGNKGKFPWPVKGGVIIQSFGNHPHPTLKGIVTKNNGIDIQTEPNAKVHPIFKGTVKGIFPIPGLEKVVLVNHGEYFTVYARLENINVKIGQLVDKEDILGNVARDAEDESDKLHFEIWKQRVFQNPAPWLRVR